jgi:hypothetical protein
VIAIAIKYPAAREAQLSRRAEVEGSVAQAFATRLKNSRKNEMTARLLAGLTLTILDVTLGQWYAGGVQDVTAVAEQVMKKLSTLVAGANAGL